VRATTDTTEPAGHAKTYLATGCDCWPDAPRSTTLAVRASRLTRGSPHALSAVTDGPRVRPDAGADVADPETQLVARRRAGPEGGEALATVVRGGGALTRGRGQPVGRSRRLHPTPTGDAVRPEPASRPQLRRALSPIQPFRLPIGRVLLPSPFSRAPQRETSVAGEKPPPEQVPAKDGVERRGRPADGGSRSLIHLRCREGLLEIQLERGFAVGDLVPLKAIPGRRWLPNRGIWTVPDSPASHEALKRAFGDRLVFRRESPGGVGAPRTGVAGEGARDGGSAPHSREERTLARGEIEETVARLRTIMRTRGYSPKTERAYLGWVRRFCRFHATVVSHIEDVNVVHAHSFLEHLANHEGLAPKSRNQAASALGFLFREILGRDDMAQVPRASGPRRIPTVLSHREATRVIAMLNGKYRLIASLLYSAGLRIEECLNMRVKDVDFELRQILVRDGKGRKDRFVPLADRVCDPLRAQLRRVAELHARSRKEGGGWVSLPGALHRKDPSAGYELAWQFVFPAAVVRVDPSTGRPSRAPLHATAVQRAVKDALKRSGIQKRASCHTFRHSFATELLRSGCDIRTLQQVMGHKDIRTTMIYLHAVQQTGLGIRSPFDRPDEENEESWLSG
jgi:integron integrase